MGARSHLRHRCHTRHQPRGSGEKPEPGGLSRLLGESLAPSAAPDPGSRPGVTGTTGDRGPWGLPPASRGSRAVPDVPRPQARAAPRTSGTGRAEVCPTRLPVWASWSPAPVGGTRPQAGTYLVGHQGERRPSVAESSSTQTPTRAKGYVTMKTGTGRRFSKPPVTSPPAGAGGPGPEAPSLPQGPALRTADLRLRPEGTGSLTQGLWVVTEVKSRAGQGSLRMYRPRPPKSLLLG